LYNESLSLLNSFQGHTGQINSIKQSPFNKDYVGTASADFTAKVWNIASSLNWILIFDFTGHSNNSVNDLEFINNDTIASGGNDYTIKIWSINSGIINRNITTDGFVYALQLMSNGFYLAAGLTSCKIRIYDFNDGSLKVTLVGHTRVIMNLKVITADLFASSGHTGDNTVRIWDLKANIIKYNLTGHNDSVRGLKLVSSDMLASGSIDFKIKLWDINDGKLVRTLTGHTGSVSKSIDLIKSQILVSGGWDATIKLWNICTGELLNSINTDMSIRALAVLNANITTGLTFLWLFSKKFLKNKKKFFIIDSTCPTTSTTIASSSTTTTTDDLNTAKISSKSNKFFKVE
jgi:WD40 repeat protein